MQIHDLLSQYRTSEQTPVETVKRVYDRIETDDTNAWITLREKEAVLADAAALETPTEKPLYGIPFAVKDNIDCSGLATSAGCPAYAYEPSEDATVVSKLLDAGALLIGKTNMDQFASGLVGTRTPYGVCRNVHNSEYISGGSSSGSAIAVARNHVAFALGTDTAGSGRVPAALNSLVGLKPSRGLVSRDGVVPACKSLDCVSVFAHSCRDALLVEEIVSGYDRADPYSRSDRSLADNSGRLQSLDMRSLTLAVPEPDALEFFGDDEAKALYEDAIETVSTIAGEIVTIDLEIFTETADLLYGGPWVAERLAAVEEFVDEQPREIHPVVREILTGGREYSAVETFNSLHRLEEFKNHREAIFATHGIDVLMTPTTGTVYTIAEIRDQPIERNSNLGYYTDYVNLLDLSAIVVPTGTFEAGPGFGLTLLGDPGDDRLIATVGHEIRSAIADPEPSGDIAGEE